MPARWQTQRRDKLDDVLDRIPERFTTNISVTVEHGQMVGLSDYTRDLDRWLRDELGIPQESPRYQGRTAPVSEVMEALGVPPSEWFRQALSNQ